MRHFFLFLCLLFSISYSYSAKLNLDSLSDANPRAIIKDIKNKKFDHLSKKQKNYLFLKTNFLCSNFKSVDSLLKLYTNTDHLENDSSFIIKCLFVESNYKKVIDEFEDAFSILYGVADYAKKKKDTSMLIEVNTAIIETSRAIKNYNLGLKYIEKSDGFLKECLSRIESRVYIQFLNRKAALYAQSKYHADSVESISLLAIQLAEQINDKNLQAISHNEVGFYYMNSNVLDKAEYHLKKALSSWDEVGAEIYGITARINLSRLYDRKSEYQKGIDLLLVKKGFIDSTNLKGERGDYYEHLARLYSKINQFEIAYRMQSKAKKILLDVAEKNYDERLILNTYKLEVEKQNQKLLENDFKIALNQNTIAKKVTENTLLYISLISLTIITILVFLILLNRNKQKKRLEKNQRDINEINAKLSSTILQKEALVREINHRVKNNLSILSSLLFLQERKLTNPEAKLALKNSLGRINTIALIHESLYERDDMESVNFQEYLLKLLYYHASIYSYNTDSLSTEIDCKDFNPELKESIPLAMIISELITNSFKHAFNEDSEKKATIKIYCENGSLFYLDNGPGYSDDAKENSLGLKLIQLFAKQLKAKITTVTIKELTGKQINMSQTNG